MTILADGARFDRNNGAPPASAADGVVRIGDLSRIIEHDIEVLKTNLAQSHYGRERDEIWEGAWARLESAWETVRSELADGETSTTLTETPLASSATDAGVPVEEPTATSPTVPVMLKALPWSMGTWASVSYSRAMQVVRWGRERTGEVSVTFTSFAHKFTSTGATHLGKARLWLLANGRRQVKAWQDAWWRLESVWVRRKLAGNKTPKPLIEVATPPNGAMSVALKVDRPMTTFPALAIDRNVSRILKPDIRILRTIPAKYRSGLEREATCENVHGRLENAMETMRSRLADGKMPASMTEVAFSGRRATAARSQVEEPVATSLTPPFVVKPLPWVLGALSPVISSRTMQMHHGCHHAQCIELANRLSGEHEELVGKSSLEIVRWARQHARDKELLTAASDAWNHAFFWQSLTPWKKRPSGDLRRALDRAFGDFTNFAEKFASAGAAHLGSGWLWLVANRRKQVRILTTSDTDCPEARGHACLLAIDLWEHAYYFDHQNRRREYLEAVIDRRLDWEFAEHRYRLATERATPAARVTLSRPGSLKRGRHHKRQRKPATSRR
jgi:superoxide dismutase, Fe-Mn family